jgi:hypothetical protein
MGETGDRRIIRRFLWMPETFDCEQRWFETAYIWQEFQYGRWWVDEGWATRGDYENFKAGRLGKRFNIGKANY